MDSKHIKILIGIAIVVALVIIVGILVQFGVFSGGISFKGKDNAPQIGATPQGYVNPENSKALPTVQGGTREEISTNIPTPEINSTGVKSGVAIPVNVIQMGSVSQRQFVIKGVGDKYIPSIIVINQNDSIDLTLEAVDKTYNIFFPDFGVTGTAVVGKNARMFFQPSNYGEYKFYCKNVCSDEVVGTLIVNKK